MARGHKFLEQDDERIERLAGQGRCAKPGPYGTVCTEYSAHWYSHYDAGDDSSWQDDWKEYR